MTTIISTRPSTEVFSPNEKIVHKMSLLALNNDYHQPYRKNQLDDDDKSDSTDTIVESPKRMMQESWVDPPIAKYMHSSDLSSSIFSQSSLSPLPPPPQPQSQPQPQPRSQSKLSLFKSKFRKVFRFTNTSSSCNIHNQPSLPLISPSKWSPPIESLSPCSNSSTLESPGYRTCRYRHSLETIQLLEQRQPRRFSSSTRLRERLCRSVSLSGLRRYPSKGILRNRDMCSLQHLTREQRWSGLPLKEKGSVLSKRTKAAHSVTFNKMVNVYETYSKADYDRSSDPDAVCTRLTALVATQIKEELNSYKHDEMVVHESSKSHTHYFL